MRLEKHIETLLLNADCVMVPGFGGFVAQYVPANYDVQEGFFFPPKRTVGFNPKLDRNDSLIVQSYVEAYDLPYPEALNLLEKDVAELKSNIDRESSHSFSGIGILRMSPDGVLLFEPFASGILTPYLYGLEAFEMSEIQMQEKEDLISKTSHPEDINGGAKDSDYIRIKKSWLQGVAATVAIVIALFLFTFPIEDSIGLDTDKSNIQSAAILSTVSLTPVESIITEKNTVKDSALEKEKVIEKAIEEVESCQEINANNVTDAPYCIVLASKVGRKGAESFIEEMKQKGFNEIYLYENNNNLRVVYGHYSTERDAYNVLRGNSSNRYFKEGWVYKKK